MCNYLIEQGQDLPKDPSQDLPSADSVRDSVRGKPTAAAMRAAERIRAGVRVIADRHTLVPTVRESAAIIDAETGLPELIAAIELCECLEHRESVQWCPFCKIRTILSRYEKP